MIVPDFDALIDDWEEFLSVSMLMEGEAQEAVIMADATEENMRRETAEGRSAAIVPWVPTSGNSENQYVHEQQSRCMEVAVAGEEHVERRGIAAADGYDFAGGKRVNPIPANTITRFEYDATSHGTHGGDEQMEFINVPTDIPTTNKRSRNWGILITTLVGQGTLEDVIRGVALKSEIEEVVARVEKAIGDLPSSSSNKRLRKKVYGGRGGPRVH